MGTARGGGTCEQSAVQWEGAMSLRRKSGGNMTQSAYFLNVEVYGMLDYFNGFHDDLRMESVSVCQRFYCV
jgi:hypothetical protein